MKSDGYLNGHGANGSSSVRSNGSHSKQDEELVRLMIQALGNLGYAGALHKLSEESGVKVESALVEDFRTAVLDGDWVIAEEKLCELELNDPNDRPQALFLIREQKLLEALEEKQLSTALTILRTELAPLKYSTERLHFLSSLVMINSTEDLRSRARWSGTDGSSRNDLLKRIASLISPNSMIPENRLTTLLDTARQAQIEDCLYHTSSAPISYLIPNHICPRSAFPLETSRILRDHTDEVWHVQYSNNGRYLASASADGVIMLYDAQTFTPVQRLKTWTTDDRRRDKDTINRGITHMCFNHDDTALMTCSQHNVIIQWDLSTGNILNQISQAHEEAVSSACWLPGPSWGFVSGGMDKKIHLYNENGEVLYTWDTGRTYDMKVSHDGKYLVAICTECTVYVFDLTTKERLAILHTDHELTSVVLSRDSSRILLSCSPARAKTGDSHAMEVQELSFPDLQPLRTVEGQKQGTFVIKSCYAGYAEQFIMSGSEDNNIYLWHRKSGTLLERIPGHTKSVGTVAWSPLLDQWASASDDGTVRIWGEINTDGMTE